MRQLIVWCLFLCLTKGRQSSHYPNACTTETSCTCSRSTRYPKGWKADCSGKNLTISPYFGQNVVEINLSNNRLSQFPNGSKLPNRLVALDISRNAFTIIQKNSFANLRRLETLLIEQNRYDLDSTLLTKGMFKDLINLRYLNVKRKGSTNDHYPENAISDLVSLRTLLINGRRNGFGPNFRKLKKLRTLDISGKKGNNCSLKYFHHGYFDNVTNIRSLDVSMCNLQNLLRNTFSELHQLHEPDISHNEELSFSILRNMSSDLKSTAIEVLKLNKIHCTFGVGTELYISDLIDLQNTSLKEFHVENNRLETVQSGVLMFLPKSLQHIFVSDNRFVFGMYVLETANLVNVKTVDSSKQYLSHRPKIIYRPCNDNHERSSKKLSQDSFSAHRSSKFNILDIEIFANTSSHTEKIPFGEGSQSFVSGRSSRKKYKFPFPPFLELVPLPQHLENLYVNFSKLRYRITHFKVGNNRLKQLYAQDNVFYEWIGPVENVHKVEVLDISNNFCTNVSTFFFDFVTGLKLLKVNDNILGLSLERDQNGDTFKNLRSLRHFEMANNRIQNLPEKIFRNLVSMEILILKNNFLKEFNVNLKHMQELVYLDLSTNRLQGLTKQMMQELDLIASENKFTLDLSGNIFHCNCEQIDFIRWLITSHISFIFNKDDVCITKFSKTGDVPLRERNEFLRRLEKECTSYTVLIVTLTSVILVIITIIVCALIYRFRWKLRYLYYMTKGRHRGYTSIKPTNGSKEEYQFDAFISYADEDRTFAFHSIMENLESDGRLNLCFHNRDFTPGFDIAENITRAIHTSRKTVCVLSRNYLKSYWCMYELNIGRMESIYSRKGEEILFLVLYDQIASSNIPLSIMDLIDKKSYIEYPNDPQGDVVFWQKIREAILM